jgi:hypothetical protein
MTPPPRPRRAPSALYDFVATSAWRPVDIVIAGWLNVAVVPFTQYPTLSAVVWPAGVVTSDEPEMVYVPVSASDSGACTNVQRQFPAHDTDWIDLSPATALCRATPN